MNIILPDGGIRQDSEEEKTMSKHINMTQGKPLKLLVSFAIPLMFGNIFQQLYTVVDTAIVGRGVGLDALAALGSVDWLNWMVLGLAFGFTQGFSVRISQKFGEGDMEGLKQIAGQSAFLSAAISVVSTLLVQLALPLILTLLNVRDDLRGTATLYTRILLGGMTASVFYNYCASVLRAIGDSRTPLVAMVVASVVNIALDCVAVFLLGWGVAGAAAATVAAQCLAGVICLWKIFATPDLRFGWKQVIPVWADCRDLLKIGTPIAAKNTVIAVGGMAIQSIVNGFSVSFIAGFIATNKLYGLLEIAAISYSYAVTTYVGQNYGAGNFDRIRKGVRSATSLSLITSVVIAVVMLVFGRNIISLFISSEDPGMVAAASDTSYVYLCVMSAFLPVLYLLYVFLSALQGIGKTVSTMVSGIIELVSRVSFAVVVAWIGIEYLIFGAEVTAWLGAAIFLGVSYFLAMRKLDKSEQRRSL